jgi:hypothetical protein
MTDDSLAHLTVLHLAPPQMIDVGVLDIEFFRLAPQTDFDTFERALATGAALGARHAIAAADDADRSRLVDHFGRLCDA